MHTTSHANVWKEIYRLAFKSRKFSRHRKFSCFTFTTMETYKSTQINGLSIPVAMSTTMFFSLCYSSSQPQRYTRRTVPRGSIVSFSLLKNKTIKEKVFISFRKLLLLSATHAKLIFASFFRTKYREHSLQIFINDFKSASFNKFFFLFLFPN